MPTPTRRTETTTSISCVFRRRDGGVRSQLRPRRAGAPEPLRLFSGSYDSADIAVHVFFVMSGFLIAASRLNSRSVLDFAAKRALRIMPALIVSVLFVVLVIGPLATRLPLGEYFSAPGTFAYLSNAALITEFRLPGVFASNPSRTRSTARCGRCPTRC